jgi:hypothetical protein
LSAATIWCNPVIFVVVVFGGNAGDVSLELAPSSIDLCVEDSGLVEADASIFFGYILVNWLAGPLGLNGRNLSLDI